MNMIRTNKISTYANTDAGGCFYSYGIHSWPNIFCDVGSV